MQATQSVCEQWRQQSTHYRLKGVRVPAGSKCTKESAHQNRQKVQNLESTDTVGNTWLLPDEKTTTGKARCLPFVPNLLRLYCALSQDGVLQNTSHSCP